MIGNFSVRLHSHSSRSISNWKQHVPESKLQWFLAAWPDDQDITWVRNLGCMSLIACYWFNTPINLSDTHKQNLAASRTGSA